MTAPALLEVRGLSVSFPAPEGVVRAVDDVSLVLHRGEVLALVGESGCGKTTAVSAVMGLTRWTEAATGGHVLFEGEELLGASEERLRAIRGARMAMVFQDAGAALNPVLRVGDQIAEQIRAHGRLSRAEALERAVALLEMVRIPGAANRARRYPHELSGGMRQRVLIAMALSCGPDVLIADEPASALDVTVQAQVLDLLVDLAADAGAGVILVTHDLGVVAQVADRVAVMYSGRIVEEAPVERVLSDPQHPYTWGLLGSVARLDGPRDRRLPAIGGAPPSLTDPPAGCHFRPRCPHAFERCPQVPALEARVGPDVPHRDRCWLAPDEKRDRRVRGGLIGLYGDPAA